MKKFVLWLHNKADFRDDDWKVFYAKDRKDALKKSVAIQYNTWKFSRGVIYTAKEFKKKMGISA